MIKPKLLRERGKGMSRVTEFRAFHKILGRYIEMNPAISLPAINLWSIWEKSMEIKEAGNFIFEQFTGKSYKNQKIFDGDVLRNSEGVLYFVFWDDTDSCFRIQTFDYERGKKGDRNHLIAMEIVGTIHDKKFIES